MTVKALLIGINAYADAPLAGCVNDVRDMAGYLVEEHSFAKSAVRLLLDKRATAKAILERIDWLVDGAKKGDRLVLHFSGHGTQVADRNKDEVDCLDETLVPFDFDWDNPETWITDDVLRAKFENIPAGVAFAWVSDCCHSGTLVETGVKTARKTSKNVIGAKRRKTKIVGRSRYLEPPLDHEWRIQVAAEREIVPTRIKGSTPHLAFVSGCMDEQTSMDAEFAGRPNGALTYYLLKALRGKGKGKSFEEVVRMVRTDLKRARYEQVPQVEGVLKDKPFLTV